MNYKKTIATLLTLAALLTLVGFVPTGLRLYEALNESVNLVTLERAVPVKSPN